MTDLEKVKEYIQSRIELLSKCYNDASEKTKQNTFGIEFELHNILRMIDKIQSNSNTQADNE